VVVPNERGGIFHVHVTPRSSDGSERDDQRQRGGGVEDEAAVRVQVRRTGSSDGTRVGAVAFLWLREQGDDLSASANEPTVIGVAAVLPDHPHHLARPQLRSPL
jgi:hypothetical protein